MDQNGNVDLYNIGKTPEALQTAIKALRADFDSHIHDGGSSKLFQTLVAETISARAWTIRKSSYTDTTAGLWAGLVGDTMKMYVGDANNFMKWDGATLTISGAITGGSLNINNNAIIDSSGNATFIGVTSLNLKAYTNFENSGRFILTGDVAPTFGNNGMVVAPVATATHYARALWWITNYLFNNNPSFTCSLLALSVGSGEAVGFIGLGKPTITGSGITESGTNYCGFEFSKVSGVLTVIAIQCDGGGTPTFSGTLATLSDNDSLELFIKMTPSGINYYTRYNGGALSAATTLTTHMPSGSETYISFIMSNKGDANNIQIQMQCAAYEH